MQTLSSPISQTSDINKEQLPRIASIPLLQKALDGLDTSLDEELDRYRHWQENGQTFSYLNPFRSPSRSSVNATSANPVPASIQLPKVPLPSTPNNDRVAKNVSEVRSDRVNTAAQDRNELTNVKSAQYLEEDNTQSTDTADTTDTAENIFEQLAATTLEPPNPDPIELHEEISEDDLFQTIGDEYANGEEFNSDYLDDEDDEYEEDGEFVEEDESDSAGFNLFSPMGITGLSVLLAASGFIGYLVFDPAGITKLLNPGKPNPTQPTTSTTPENTDSDINLKQTAPNVNPDTLLADPKKNSKLIPFVPLAGRHPQPGQSVKGFTSSTDRSTAPTRSIPGLSTGLSTPKDRPAVSKLSVPALPTTKAARLSTPKALPPAISPYQPESEPYVPPVQNTYEPPARDTYTPPAPVYRSNPEPRPQVNPAPYRPRVTTKWKPRTTTPTLSTPSKAAAASNPTPVALPAPSKANTTAITAPPIRDSAPVRYSSPISTAPSNPAPETPARPANTGYKVVAPTSYLPQAQAVDKDAYVRPTGEVQLGAYQNAKAAQQRADDLRRQGIPVQVEQQ